MGDGIMAIIESCEKKDIYKKAISHYGAKHQMFKTVEELAELSAALMKYNLEGHGKLNVLEEVADVIVMIEQLRIILDADSVIDGIIESKLMRLGAKLATRERFDTLSERSPLANVNDPT